MLQKGKLGRYATIVNVFRFTDLTVLKFLVSALMVAMLGIQSLISLGLADSVPIAPTYMLGNLIGGLVFGVGMALVGFCPGTVAAGAGEGRLDNLIPGSLGLYTGAVVFGATYPKVFPAIASVANLGSVTVMRVWKVDAWLIVALVWEASLLLFYRLERGPLRPRRHV